MLGSSSIGSRIILYNSMNLQPSDGNLNQVKALHSQDNKSVPPLEQCLFLYTETGWTDCGLYAITYVVDLAAGNNPSDIIYDQSAICSYLSRKIEYQFFHNINYAQIRIITSTVWNILIVQKNGHFFGKLVLRNNLGQHHLYITKLILTNFTTKKRKDNVSVLEHDLNFVLHWKITIKSH